MKIYSVNLDPKHLLLVDGDHVVNGSYRLVKRKEGPGLVPECILDSKMIAYPLDMKAPKGDDYNDVLEKAEEILRERSKTVTLVVNFKKEACDVKITRNAKGQVPEPPKFGCFGNPYTVEKYGRTDCIELFQDYFLERVQTDIVFRNAVLSLKGKRLGCFCNPLPCHGHVIKKWLDLQENFNGSDELQPAASEVR